MEFELDKLLSDLKIGDAPGDILYRVQIYNHSMLAAAMKYYLLKEYDKAITYLLEVHGVYVRYVGVYYCYPCQYTKEAKLNLDRDILSFKNISENRMNEFCSQVAEMPPEWTLLQITRIASSQDSFLPASASRPLDKFFVLRIPCGSQFRKEYLRLWGFEVPKNWLQSPIDVVREFIKLHTEKTPNRHENFSRRKKASATLEEFMENMGSMFNEYESWFLGRLYDSKLEKSIRRRIDTVFKNHGHDIDVGKKYEIYLMAEACADIPENTIEEACLCLKNGALGEALVREIKKIRQDFGSQLSNARRHPVILITDEIMDQIPWECLPTLKNHPVTRMSSIHLLYALFIFHKPNIRNGLREIDGNQTGYFVIDPEVNLPLAKLNSFFAKRFPSWKGLYQEKPDVDTIISAFSSSNSYFYCGHGGGINFLKGQVNIQRLNVNCIPLLFGCSSIAHKDLGGISCRPCDAWGYILAGSCCTLGMMFPVLTGDADIMTTLVANICFPGQQINPENLEKMEGEHEPELLRILPLARRACSYFGNGAAFVARGIPVKLV